MSDADLLRIGRAVEIEYATRDCESEVSISIFLYEKCIRYTF